MKQRILRRNINQNLEVFIKESKLEDFFNENGETIFVSTIHKSKGKEFDNVFLMLDDFDISTDEKKRLLYVGMTRAKRNLTIHLNGNYLNNISVDILQKVEDKKTYLPPSHLTMQLTYKDVWLDYFINKQHLLSKLVSGDILLINGDECKNPNGQSILKFSGHFLETIESLKQKNYKLKQAKVNFIVYWKKEDSEQEIKIILPELYFER